MFDEDFVWIGDYEPLYMKAASDAGKYAKEKRTEVIYVGYSKFYENKSPFIPSSLNICL